MKATNLRIGAFGICTFVALAVAASIGEARPGRDAVYRAPALDSTRPATVAVLPVASVVEWPLIEDAVAAGWVGLYAGSATRWMPTGQVRERMEAGSAGPGAIAAEVDRQIWRDGAVSPLLAGHLCRLLGVDAVLAVRVDRWEIADGGRAIVEMTATITGADGRRAWSISGAAGYGTPPSSVERNFVLGSESVFFNPALEPQNAGSSLVRALQSLMARWAWQLPAPLDEEQQAALPMLAERITW